MQRLELAMLVCTVVKHLGIRHISSYLGAARIGAVPCRGTPNDSCPRSKFVLILRLDVP